MQRFDAVNREVQGKCAVFPGFLSACTEKNLML